MIYLVPSEGDFSDLSDILKRAQIPLITPASIRQMILETAGSPISIVAASNEQLLVLNRHATQLLEEVPSVVVGVPGLVYAGDWYTLASTFPPLDWSELEKKASKSGHTAHDLSAVEQRSVGSILSERPEESEPESDPTNLEV